MKALSDFDEAVFGVVIQHGGVASMVEAWSIANYLKIGQSSEIRYRIRRSLDKLERRGLVYRTCSGFVDASNLEAVKYDLDFRIESATRQIASHEKGLIRQRAALSEAQEKLAVVMIEYRKVYPLR